MKKVLVLFVVLSSCQDRTDRLKSADTIDSIAPPAIGGVTKTMIARIDVLHERPTKSFRILVRFLDSLGYSSDTARVKRIRNYKELLDSDITLIDDFPFYKINKKDTRVLWWNTLAQGKSDSLDVDVFNQASEVWGYFYGKGERDGLTVDGVIEQWKFSDAGTAQTAMGKLNACYPLPYFNTQPYYFVKGRFLFIFHTRASAFSYRQEEFFNEFKKISASEKDS